MTGGIAAAGVGRRDAVIGAGAGEVRGYGGPGGAVQRRGGRRAGGVRAPGDFKLR